MKFDRNEIFLLEELVKKNFSSKYKDSVLGIFWTFLSPLLLMAVFTIVFSTIFSGRIKNYPVYFLCGWCIFNYFNSTMTGSMMALKGNKNILQKTPAPKYIFILGVVLSELLNFIIMLIVLAGIMVVTNAPFYLTSVLSFIPIISLFIMLLGLGLIFSIACVYYADIRYLWSVIGLLIMYSSAIFYPMSIIPEFYRQFLVLSPLYWIIDQFRCFVYLGVIPNIGYMLNSLLLSLIILVIGVIVFKTYEDKITMKF